MKVIPLHPNQRGKKIGTRGSASLHVPEPKRPNYALLEPIFFVDDFGDHLEYIDYPAIAADYARKVLTGAYPGCRYVKYACKRYLTMLDMAKTGKHGFTFSDAHAIDVCTFAETLPLAEDNFRGVENVELEPWQIFVFCALYGFRDGRGFRFVNECYLEVPRKSAKSVLATVIALYDLRNPESRAPLVLIAASTLEQADRVFTPMSKTVEADEDLRTTYKLETTTKMMRCGINRGEVHKVASVGERQDGWNPTTIILEELHAQNPDVYAVLKSGMGSRGGQLLFQITTAGRNAHGLAWDNRKAAIRILEGHDVSWKQFAIIYTIDKEDMQDAAGNKKTDHLFSDEQLWLKACPNLGVSFDMGAFHMLATSARQKPQDREEFFRTRLNIWTNSASKIIDIEMFRRGARRVKLADYRKRECWIGVDLSAVDDLTAVSIVFEEPNGDIMVFTKHFMSGDSPLMTDPDYRGMIAAWIDAGVMECTKEGAVDYDRVEAFIRFVCEWHNVRAIGFDPAMAGQMMASLEKSRLPVVKYLNKAHMMTASIDDMISRAQTASRSTLLYQENPVFEWCIANTNGERKTDGTILPKKDAVDSLEKIDSTVATGMANGLRINPEYSSKVKKPSIYERRGLIGAENVIKRPEQGADSSKGDGSEEA